MSTDIEGMILSGLLFCPEFKRKAAPHIQPEHFDSHEFRVIYNIIQDYDLKYNTPPSKEALEVDLENQDSLNESLYENCLESIKFVSSDEARQAISKVSADWLSDRAEKHCRDKSIYNAIMHSIGILDGSEKQTRDAIPSILQDALAVEFDSSLGHDYLMDAESRFEFYHQKEKRVQLSLPVLNKVMKGGAPLKSMIIYVAPTGVGKTMKLTDDAAHILLSGHNVLYITMEMAEERIAERIDAKLFDAEMDNLKLYPKETFLNKINGIKNKTNGQLMIRESPAGTLNAQGVRNLVDELKNKKGFSPDVIISDYLGLHASTRFRNNDNMYQYVKAVAEELRAVALEREILYLTATQTNREGQNSTDYDLNEVGESHGISQTADAMFGLISTEELEAQNKMRIKQLKNRFGSITKPSSFMVGINRAKMTFYELDNLPDNTGDDVPSNTAKLPQKGDVSSTTASNKKDFSRFKV